MLANLYTCPDCEGTGKMENPNTPVIKSMNNSRCGGCAGDGKLTEIAAINRKLIPNPIFAGSRLG